MSGRPSRDVTGDNSDLYTATGVNFKLFGFRVSKKYSWQRLELRAGSP